MYTVDSNQIEIIEFDEASFCFHKSSAETHLISPFFALVLDVCSNSPVDAVGLAQKTASILRCEADEAWLNTNQEALHRLHLLDIVIPV